ncbi:hypothetical protein NCER_101016 [Vairimorpha ceranae BRL01]|uniref:Uncharacterized protein n=1 Tax=Vairimorpha ceranae (strain BRL01) TaxID=578460 RepID=C4V908_VAIC1|nr:hypothetical protein NCER_101016 [Vairimorpha ceranae BRL01]
MERERGRFTSLRFVYLFTSILFYFFNKQPQTVTSVKKTNKKHNVVIPYSIADIQDNSFIFVNVSESLSEHLFKKCILCRNIAYIRILNLKQAEIFTQLNLTNLEGVFFFKNRNEIYDLKNRKWIAKKYNDEKIMCWDIYFLSEILRFKAFFVDRNMKGIELSILSLLIKIVLQRMVF